VIGAPMAPEAPARSAVALVNIARKEGKMFIWGKLKCQLALYGGPGAALPIFYYRFLLASAGLAASLCGHRHRYGTFPFAAGESLLTSAWGLHNIQSRYAMNQAGNVEWCGVADLWRLSPAPLALPQLGILRLCRIIR
jgi:hypothetical protein